MLFHFYNALALTEFKGFFMMQAAWNILNKLGQGTFSGEGNMMRERFESRMSDTKRNFKVALSSAERYLNHCGAANLEEGQSFLQLTRLLQGTIMSRNDFPKTNLFQHRPFCMSDCPTTPHRTHVGNVLRCLDFSNHNTIVCPAVRRLSVTLLITVLKDFINLLGTVIQSKVRLC